jgi:putative transposase
MAPIYPSKAIHAFNVEERGHQARGAELLQQQAKFDDFIDCYHHERPHQALDMKYPAELYRPSSRPYRGLGELDYPFHDRTITVTFLGE